MPESETRSPESHWWDELPSNQETFVIVIGKVDHENLPQDIVRRRSEAASRTYNAVRSIMDFIEVNPDAFSNLDPDSIITMTYLGALAVTLKPSQCQLLFESGLVQAIAHDADFDLQS